MESIVFLTALLSFDILNLVGDLVIEIMGLFSEWDRTVSSLAAVGDFRMD